jgi:hypothetical protein
MRNSALLATLALGACATLAPPPDAPPPRACQSEGLAQFVGQPATEQLGADMQRVSGVRTLQWVTHGSMVTMDFSPQRLRVFLTVDNRVERANCG